MRQATIEISIGCDIDLVAFRSRERLGELFEIEAEIIAAARVDLAKSLGKRAMIEVFDLGKPVRRFHALLTEAHFLAEEDQGYHYALTLRPWLYALAHNRAYRVFEDMTGLDIVKQVLADQGRRVDYGRLSGRYRPRPYTTQYRESDFAFVSRVMEREGIYYFFEHRRDEHVLVLCDAPAAHRPAPGHEAIRLRPDRVAGGGLAGALWNWHEHVRADGERRFLLRSFDHETSSTRQGAADGGATIPADTQEVYDYSGDFVEPALAQHWARVALEASRARRRVYSGTGDAIGLSCGARFRLDSDDAFGRGDEFVVTALDYTVEAEPFRSGATAAPRRVVLEAVTSDTRWRSAIATPAPHAGPETAVVVAGGADDSHVDRLGRVRVRFLWGRADEAPEAARSCWLRLSYPSAGAGFGHVTLPRTDEEVIVDFLDGNPDRPIVTGRVYNSRHAPPYGLPRHRSRSVYRSRTIGRTGSYAGARATPRGPGYNELMFDDEGGAEQVYLRAQRNRLTEVLLDDEARVQRDRSTTVYRDDDTVVETGDSTLTARRGDVTIEAARRLTLRVGGNTIVIDAAGIHATSGPTRLDLTPAMLTARGLTMSVRMEMLQTDAAMTLLQGQMMTIRHAATVILPKAVGPWMPLPL
ncbi:type VI secretion system tip protein TssI/VgrG [Sphingomonas sp. BK235]|uniref:type VI secretion system Vgr family protein n=1 Tax=Sphingomonas sp. BK235 TaxID=2512131 RepID=UPI0010D4D071|nr:type VI secretion system tip protein TssI/VgrG [Sphingomonas sp. BK235]TCP33690.1 type VI secretion system secreted protein VgrG [Sphingomonas sp. BK235]